MRRAHLGYAAAAIATLAVHFAAFGGLSVMKKPAPETQRVAVMMSAPKPKKKAKPPEPPKPIEAPKELLRRAAAPAKAPPPVTAPPPNPVAAAHPALAAMPDFGINLSGGPGGGGIAVPMGNPAPVAAASPVKEKTFGNAAERPAVAADDCQEDLVKAKAQGFVQPTYTDDARSAGIEGRVRVQVSIDASGAVTEAKVLTGLGHGLDESAVAAAKRMSFSPATRCGKATASSLMVAMRFVLGE